MLAVGVAVVLGFSAGDAWPLLPIAIWIAIYLALREWARTRPQRERAKAQQKTQAKRRRVDEHVYRYANRPQHQLDGVCCCAVTYPLYSSAAFY